MNTTNKGTSTREKEPESNSQEVPVSKSAVSPSTRNREELKYPTAEILLSTIQKEYDIEASRKRDIETRAGILVALLGALIGFYTSNIDFLIFKKATTALEYLSFVFVGLIYIIPLVTLFFSLKIFLDVLTTKQYQRVGIGGYTEDIAKQPKDRISLKLAQSYKAVVEENGKSNEDKAIHFKKGINLMYKSLIAVIIAYLVKQIVSLIS